MNNLSLRFLALWLCCLCSSLGLEAQTISAGTSPVCKGSTGTYTVTGGPAGTAYYQWHAPGGGALTSPNNLSTVSVLWGVAGTTSVSVDAMNASNMPIGTATYAVTVSPLPTPVITSNVRVGCQVWIPPVREPNPEQPAPPGDPSMLDDGQGCVKVCEVSPVVYTANGSPGSTFTWTIGGGTPTTATGNVITVNWGAAGPGNITVTETTAGGCVGTRQICIEKIQKPKANFFEASQPSATTITTCLDNTLYFQDASIGSASSPIVEWLWDFGDGTFMTSLTSTTEAHTYTSAGNFAVTLTVKNACGCTDRYRLTVRVQPKKGVKIVCPAVVCEGEQGTYSLDPAVSCSPYQWSASGGHLLTPSNNPTANIVWDAVGPSGFGYVNFNSAGCGISCPGITTVKIPVIQVKGTIDGPLVACPNSQALFNLPQWPSTVFNWTVVPLSTTATLVQTDQNNQIAANTQGPGDFLLRCQYTNTLLGCGGSAEIRVRVLPPDSIIGPKLVCLNSSSTTFGLASGMPGTWTLSLPDGSVLTYPGVPAVTPVFPITGTYTLSVSGAFCAPKPLVIRVNPLPPAPDSIVGPTEACFGAPTKYKAGGPLPGTVLSWGISGGGNASPLTGSTTYATFSGTPPATISVFRTTVDEAHCNSAPLTLSVGQPHPTGVIAGIDTACPSTEYPFSFPYAEGEVYTWQVLPNTAGSVQGAGNTQAVNILWNQQSGVHRVRVTVTRCGTDYTFEKEVYVRPTAVPNITLMQPAPLCRDEVFTASAGIPGMATWDWGDGSPVSSSPVHSYTALSTGNLSYTISVALANPYGCPGTVTGSLNVTVLPAPVANITPAGPFVICSGSPNQILTPTLQSGYEPTVQLDWTRVGTGIVSTCAGTPPSCTYNVTSLGSYFVVATGANGCTAQSNTVVFDTTGCTGSTGTCTLTPNPSLTLTGINSCGHVSLSGSYSGPPPTATNWDWGGPLNALNVMTTNTSYDADFNEAGLYSFVYAVTFNDGTNICVRRKTASILVPLVPDMGYTVACAPGGGGYVVTLQDHSNYYPGYVPVKFTFWVDGVPVATVFPPGNSYPVAGLAPGVHNFKTVTYYGPNDSCSSTASFDVPNPPVASFTADSVVTCVDDQAVQFTNGSTGINLSYLWDFNGTSTNAAQDPYKVYDGTGNFNVLLTVTDKYGCQAIASQLIDVQANNLKVANIDASPNPVCGDAPITLQYLMGTATATPDSYTWMESDNLLYTTNVDNTTVFTPGAYWLLGSNAIGCRVTTERVIVNVNEVPTAIITGDSSACLDQSFTLYGYAGPGLSYTWKKGAVTVGTGDSYTEVGSAVGIYTYTLTITSTQFGITCSKTSAPFTVIVNPPPPPPSIAFNVGPCNPYTVDLFASGSGTSFNWSNGQTGPHITTNGGGAYRVWMTDANGCRSHEDVDVPKDPRAYLWIFPTGCYTFCDNSLPRTITGPIEWFNFWDWFHNGGPVQSHPNPPNPEPVASYDLYNPGIYNLEIGNLWCQNVRSDDMVVDIVPCSGNGCGQLIQFSIQEFRQTGPCDFALDFVFNSSLGSAVGVSLSASTGSVSPGGALVSPGYNLIGANYYPPAGFGGGIVTFTMTFTDPKTGEKYTCTYDVKVPPCKPSPRPGPGDGARMASPGGAADASTGLWLVPNPATSATRADYVLHAGTREGSIEVYDVTGRLMSRAVVDGKAASGTVSLKLADYVPGLYMVVLREEGRVTQQSRLTVIR